MEKKKIGIWMDHSTAQLMEYGRSANEIQTIHSEYVSHPRTKGMGSDTTTFSSSGFHVSNNEYKKNKIKQQKYGEYYDKLEHLLLGYEDILLLGATNAKEEFFNRIKDKPTFKNKKIYIHTTDHLTPNQLAALINKEFFKEEEEKNKVEQAIEHTDIQVMGESRKFILFILFQAIGSSSHYSGR